MVIYRSIGYSHNCPPSGCVICKESYGAPPPDPENYEQCCRYTEGGEHVVVVLTESSAPMVAKPKRPRSTSTRGRSVEPATRRVTIKPTKAEKKKVGKKRASPASKPRRSTKRR